jgi:hypothetical protein
MESRNPIPALEAVRFDDTPLGWNPGRPMASDFFPKGGFVKADHDFAIPPTTDRHCLGILGGLRISVVRSRPNRNRTRIRERKAKQQNTH